MGAVLGGVTNCSMENSEVLPLLSVAVATILSPRLTVTVGENEKVLSVLGVL